jgi:hypothetical protein
MKFKKHEWYRGRRAANSAEKTEFQSPVYASITGILVPFCCKTGERGEGNFSEMSDIMGNVRYHRKLRMMSLLNIHAGNKFRSPEGLVLCHPVMLAEKGLRTSNSALPPFQ